MPSLTFLRQFVKIRVKYTTEEGEYTGTVMNCIYRYNSPLGQMTMAGSGDALTGLWFDGQKYFANTLSKPYTENLLPVFEDTIRWLDIYFGGDIPDFLPKLSLNDTDFRMMVWKILLTIPYGETSTYGKIAEISAKNTGARISARAVGGAVGRNPVSIIIPCHRVLGSNGSLTGYAGGLERKQRLLELEKSGKIQNKC